MHSDNDLRIPREPYSLYHTLVHSHLYRKCCRKYQQEEEIIIWHQFLVCSLFKILRPSAKCFQVLLFLAKKMHLNRHSTDDHHWIYAHAENHKHASSWVEVIYSWGGRGRRDCKKFAKTTFWGVFFSVLGKPFSLGLMSVLTLDSIKRSLRRRQQRSEKWEREHLR